MHTNVEAAIDSKVFMASLQPCLSEGKLQEAIALVRQHWTPRQLETLLSDKEKEVRKVAAFALAMCGDRQSIGPLSLLLHDSNGCVVEVVEHAMWSIWLRSGSCCAVKKVERGSRHLHHANYVCAIENFSQAILEDPNFAEAYNQRAIAYYLSERFKESIEDCRATLARMPQHFGAMAGMGHCFAHLGQWEEARKCYKLALAIHPRLEGIESSLRDLEVFLKDHGPSAPPSLPTA